MSNTEKKELPTTWQVFANLYCNEGLSLEEAYAELKRRGFPVGGIRAFKKRYAGHRSRQEWDKRNWVTSQIRLLSDNPNDLLYNTLMIEFQSLAAKMRDRKDYSIEQFEKLVKLADQILALTHHHPKYHKQISQTILSATTNVLETEAVSIFFNTVKKFPKLSKIFSDKDFNAHFVKELQKQTEERVKNQELLKAAPEAVLVK